MKEHLDIILKEDIKVLAAYTPKQRDAIKSRDHYKCQFPPHLNGHKNECSGRLEVHHIKPQRYLKNFGVDPDFENNGLTVCANAHTGIDPKTPPERVIHPDMREAHIIYKEDKESYKKVFKKRDEALQSGVIYWNDTYDRPMEVIAIRNTQRGHEKGWNFPPKGKKNGN